MLEYPGEQRPHQTGGGRISHWVESLIISHPHCLTPGSQTTVSPLRSITVSNIIFRASSWATDTQINGQSTCQCSRRGFVYSIIQSVLHTACTLCTVYIILINKTNTPAFSVMFTIKIYYWISIIYQLVFIDRANFFLNKQLI